MTSGAIPYAYLDTRITLLASRIYRSQELEDIIEQAVNSGQLPEGVEGRLGLAPGIRPGNVDQHVMAMLLREFAILLRPLSGPTREFLSYWARRFELSNLKAILRGKMNHEPPEAIREQLIDLGAYETLPIEQLLQGGDMAEFLRQLERTPYAEVAREARRTFEQQQELFALDASIDRRYFSGLIQRLNNLNVDGRETFRHLLATLIDRINLVWLLRYRFAYGLPPAEAYYLLVPGGRRLTSPQLQHLARQEDLPGVLAALGEPLASRLAGADTAAEVSRRMERELAIAAREVLNKARNNPARILAYMILRERDLRRGRALLRGRHLGMAPPLIRIAVGLAPLQTGEAPA